MIIATATGEMKCFPTVNGHFVYRHLELVPAPSQNTVKKAHEIRSFIVLV